MTCKDVQFTYIGLEDVLHFDSLISWIPPCAIISLSFAFASNASIHSCFLLAIARIDLFLFLQVFQFFVEMLLFGVFSSKFKCDAYIPLAHSSLYNHAKICLLFPSLNLAVLSLFYNHVSLDSISFFLLIFFFRFSLLNLVSYKIGIPPSTFPSLV